MLSLSIGLFQNVAAQSAGGLGPEIVVDGVFNVPADWSTGVGVSVTGGQAVASSAANGFGLLQSNSGIIAGHTYQLTFTISGYSAGTAGVYVGSSGSTQGTARSSNGTFTQNLTPGDGGELGFIFFSSFTGNIDNYSIKEVL